MAPGDDDDDGEISKFRWFHMLRYVVAFFVSVLIVMFISYAVVVVLRPGVLYIGVVGRSVSVERSNATAKSTDYRFSVHLQANNTTARLRFHYTNITGYLAPQSPAKQDFVLDFNFDDDISVDPLSTVDTYADVHGGGGGGIMASSSSYLADVNGSSTPKVFLELRLNGTLTIELYSWRKITRQAIYCCSDLTISAGTSVSDSDGSDDGVYCSDLTISAGMSIPSQFACLPNCT